MKYMRASLLPLLAFCLFINANTFFITNRSGYNLIVEFWKEEGSKKEDFFKVPRNSMIDITGRDKGFDSMPYQYKLKCLYLDSENKIVHVDATFLLVKYLAGKEIVFGPPNKSVDFIQADGEKIHAAERNLNFTGFEAIPFLVGDAQAL